MSIFSSCLQLVVSKGKETEGNVVLKEKLIGIRILTGVELAEQFPVFSQEVLRVASQIQSLSAKKHTFPGE